MKKLPSKDMARAGVGMLIEVVTTNRNRVVGEFRHLMSKNGGNMAEAGAVGWMFHRKGEISVPKEAASEDKLLDLVLEAGAEDLKDDGSAWYIVTPPDALEKVKEALTKAGVTPASAEIAMVPQNYIKLTGPQATQMVRLVEALEEHDDVQHVLRELRYRRIGNPGRCRRELVHSEVCLTASPRPGLAVFCLTRRVSIRHARYKKLAGMRRRP